MDGLYLISGDQGKHIQAVYCIFSGEKHKTGMGCGPNEILDVND